MKTREELNALKEEVEALSKKLAELSEDELAQVSGGVGRPGWLDVGSVAQVSGGVAPDGEGEKQGYNVAIFPGLSGFP